MTDGYRQFLEVGTDDTTYDVGFNPAWDKLRLDIVRNGWDETCTIDLWLTPQEARQLANALHAAANELDNQPPTNPQKGENQ